MTSDTNSRTACDEAGVTRHPESGIALVVTLIMLSVTLVMALAFLAVSHRERDAVSTTTDTATARLAADSALAAAQAQIAANILASTNVAAYSYGLLVSTNYINSLGFTVNSGSPTNVNYDYLDDAGHTLLSLDQRNQTIANLLFLPRAPVFIKTNQFPYGNDFRYYLDLNQNGRVEGNGLQPQFGNAGGYLHTDGTVESSNPANVLTNEMTGDPDWIGVLEHPDQPHGPNNHFIARYAFAAVPVGNTLDLNAIYNQTATRTVNPAAGGNDGFMRNQGVGSWELNLAAFLTDLNTNEWEPITAPYRYLETNGFSNTGVSFDDARALLSWRYGGNYGSLASANNVFANTLNYPFNIDLYSDRPLQTTVNTNADFPGDTLSFSWAGADNTNKFFSLPSDLFDPAKSSAGIGSFTNRLASAGAGNSSYDRYTFYRMLDQLGTDTAPERGKLNLNYSNAVVNYSNGVVTGVSIIPGAETNLVPWTATNFFNAAADLMLKSYTANWFQSSPSNYIATYYGFVTNYSNPTGFGLTNFPFFGITNQVPAFGVTNIPVQVNGLFVYSPAVNRVLQLAANLYDASTNYYYPSVFRPSFTRDNYGDLYISGYTNVDTVTGLGDFQLSTPYDASQVLLPTGNNIFVNVYGVPWIIGAKKGFPNFNKLGMQTVIQITRKLQVGRKTIPSLQPSDYIFTNQLYSFSISNTIGVECWNSYAKNYPNPVYINVQDSLSMWITNDYGLPPRYFTNYVMATPNYLVNPWPGYTNGQTASFVVPLYQSATLLTNSDLYFGTAPPGVSGFIPEGFNYGWETNRTSFDLPHFGLLTTNRFQLSMLDFSNGVYHVIDYVQLAGPDKIRDLNAALQTNSGASSYDNMWSTKLNTANLPWGIVNQWDVSDGSIPENATYWKKFGGNQYSVSDQINGFRAFLGLGTASSIVNKSVANYYASNYVVQVPYTPTATIYDYTGWQANDPLVHYLASDLTYNGTENSQTLQSGIHKLPEKDITVPMPSYSSLNERYQPWGSKVPTGYDGNGYSFGSTNYNLFYEDPLVRSSDYWNFPTNKYPTVGWIGRVHRGTPWQTVYLKAHNVLRTLNGGNLSSGTNTWVAWTGDYYNYFGNYFDAANSGPLQDRMLFDLFTTAPNENATRGQLSVNVGAVTYTANNPAAGLAAWSAFFSGMVALTNSLPDIAFKYTSSGPSNSWMVIQPAGVGGVYSQLGSVVTNINNMRAGFTNGDGVVGTFEHKGDILSVAALTEQSPFLNWNNVNQQKFGISDAAYEWLPQQAMSLLTCPTGPRYVVYCYGQTLKPAQDGLVTSSAPLAGPGNPTSFGLVTNYQVVAESASRAVIRVDRHVTAAGTNYTTTVESYNPLPPD